MLILFFALLLNVGAYAQTEQAPQDDLVVIQAGDTVITRSEFEDRFRVAVSTILAQQGQAPTPELMAQFDALRPQYLEQLALQVALLNEANERGVTVSEETVEEQVGQARQGFEDDAAFEEALTQAGFRDAAQFRELVRENSLIQQLFLTLQEDISVSDEQVEAWYDENQAQFQQPEQICARHILVDSLEEAEEIAGLLEAGEDFAALAEARSTDPGSAAQGGDLGCLPRGATVPEFEEAAFATELNTVSAPVETQFGQHLVQPYERIEAGVQPLDEVREQAREQLQREQLNEQIAALRDEADVQVFEENVAVSPPADNGATGGADTGGADTGGADTGGADTGGADTGGADTGGGN
jgi:peptidyl-prolyl cis-trans isomerase C